MWIALEPNGWMAYVNFCFSRARPAAEDDLVRQYLGESQLKPRRVLQQEEDGEALEVWQYGECYIGPHMHRVGALRWQGMLSEVLAEVIKESGAMTVLVEAFAAEEKQALLWELAGSISPRNAAMIDKDDPSKVHFDQALVQSELERLLAARAPEQPARQPNAQEVGR